MSRSVLIHQPLFDWLLQQGFVAFVRVNACHRYHQFLQRRTKGGNHLLIDVRQGLVTVRAVDDRKTGVLIQLVYPHDGNLPELIERIERVVP